MADLKFFSLLRSLGRMPQGIRTEIVLYYIKKLTGIKPTDHQTLWTSFLYFSVTQALKISDDGELYWVDFEYKGRRTRTSLRKGGSSDIFVFFHVFIAGGYQVLIDSLNRKSFAPAVIIDVGANVGYFSLIMKLIFPDAKILCVEPAPSNFDQLKKNLMDAGNEIQFVNAALATSNQKLWLKNAQAGEWAFQFSDDLVLSTAACEGTDFSSLILNAGIERIDLLKIDIEGMEARLFGDASFLSELGKVTILAMEIHDKFADRGKIHEQLAACGFSFFDHGELTIAVNQKKLIS